MILGAIHPCPFWYDLRRYSFGAFGHDLSAALSVALLALPQAMAYAFVAGLPPQVGIFSAIFGTIFTAAFGSSRYLVSGPTTQSAILLQSGISEIIYTYYNGLTGVARDELAIKILIQVVLLIGVFQLFAGLLRLGRLTQFTSRSVVLGYTIGVAVAIFFTQLYPFFGIAPLSGYHPLYQKAWYLIHNIALLHLPTTLLGLGCLVVLILCSRVSKKIPIAIFVFFIAAAVVYFFNLSPDSGKAITDVAAGEQANKITILSDLGPLYSDLPKLKLPIFDFHIIGKVIPLAFAIALLSVLQATAIGKFYTRAKEPPYNDNQEIYGLGISNLFSAFVGAMPSSGSFARSALNHSMGARTRFSAIYSGGFLFLIVIFLGFLVTRIPLAALSALMVITAYSLVSFKDLFLCVRATRSDAFTLLITLIACLLFTFDMALYIGIAVSIVLYLKQAAVPLLIEYSFNNVGKLRPIEPEDERPDSRIAIVQAEGELFFGAADLLQGKLREVGEDEMLKVVILQLLNVRHIDASIALALKTVHRYLDGTGRVLLITGISPDVYSVLRHAGLADKLGKDRLFIANEQLPSEPTRTAYAYAKNLLSI